MGVPLLYREIINPDEARTIAALLHDNGIWVDIEDDTGPADFTKPFNVLSASYKIRLQGSDFARADELLKQYYEEQVAHASPDYFLFQFSDRELIDVVLKEDEWGDYNALLARNILAERGILIPEAMSEGIKSKRLEELRQPEAPADSSWLLYGYLSVLFGGVLGIWIGWYLATSRKTLPNGERQYRFALRDRRHGYRIFLIGLIIFLSLVVLRLSSDLTYYINR